MYLTVNNRKIHYKVSGKGIPLLLIHGNGETLEIFDDAVKLL